MSKRTGGMKEKKTGRLLDRRDLLKLLPQTAACLALFHPSRTLTESTLENGIAAVHAAKTNAAVAAAANDDFTADWIWEPIEAPLAASSGRLMISRTPSFRNLFTYFRKSLDLSSEVRRATVRITGDMHWVNAALGHIGEYDRMLELMVRGFGKMIDAGATTIWETWSPDASECHGWSTTPAYDLMTYVLGVRIVTPGCAEFAIEPHPGNLRWLRGKVPSVRGDISVHWENSGTGFRLEGDKPKGCLASALVPLRDGAWPTKIETDGQTSAAAGATKEKNGTRVSLSDAGRFSVFAGYG
jgi:hypothetical protein